MAIVHLGKVITLAWLSCANPRHERYDVTRQLRGAVLQRPGFGETDRILWAARTLDAGRKLKRAARAKSRALGVAERLIASLTAGAVRVLEELLTLARLTRGRAQVTGLGRAAIVRAIACLEAVGFLVRQRWFVRVPGEGAGPRYAQASNLYRLLLPGTCAVCCRAGCVRHPFLLVRRSAKPIARQSRRRCWQRYRAAISRP